VTARQLPLDLAYRPALGRADFMVASSNEAAVAWIDRWPDWPRGRLLIHGPSGSGKSHLAAVWCARSGAAAVPAETLAVGDVPALAAHRALVVEDVERIGDPAALLHLYNLADARAVSILFTAAIAPGSWRGVLADLVSRLKTVMSAEILAPDDALLAAVLAKLFADRRIAVDPDLVDYLLPRMERSFAAVGRIVAALDRAGLAERRRVTVALARTVLGAPTTD